MFLDLVEKTGEIAAWDSESSGRQGDYDRLYVISVKPFGKPPVTFKIGSNLQDKGLVKEARDYLNSFKAWITFYGRGFDTLLLNTRLLRWGYPPLEKIPHVDMYFQLKYKLLTGRKSQAHLLEFLEDTMTLMGITPEKKISVSPNVWSDLPTHYKKNIAILVERCESDTCGLEALYRTTRQMIREITR